MIYDSSSASIPSSNPNNTHQPYPSMHSQMADQQQKSQKNLQHVPLMRPSGIHRAPQFQSESDEDIQQVHSKLRRGPWSPEEDNKLLELVQFFGGEKNLNWVKISEELQTRTAKQARERFHQNLKPSLNRTPITPEEGRYIEELVEKYGKRWAEIARHLNGRSDNAIKNWWNGGANRRKRASTQGLTVTVNGSSSSGDEEEKTEYNNDSKFKQQLQSQLQRSKDSNEHPLTPGLQSISSNPPNTVHHGYYSQHQLPQISSISTTASTSSPLSSLQFSSSSRSTTNSFSGLPPPPVQPLGNPESTTLPPINSVLRQQQQQQQVPQIESEQPNQPNQPQFNVSIFGENDTAHSAPPQLSSTANPSHQHHPVIPPHHHLYLQSGQSHSPDSVDSLLIVDSRSKIGS